MGLPGKRSSRSSKRRRASHFALRPLHLFPCPKCKRPILPHRACPFCGTYRGKEIFSITKKIKLTKIPKGKAKREKKEEKRS